MAFTWLPPCGPQCTREEYEEIARELVKLAEEVEGLPKLFRLGFHTSGHWSASGLNGGPSGGWHRCGLLCMLCPANAVQYPTLQ